MFHIQSLIKSRQEEKSVLYEKYINPFSVKSAKRIGTYREYVKGEGAYLFDKDGNCYLDCDAGSGVFNLGRNHPKIREAIHDILDLNPPNMVYRVYIYSNGIVAPVIYALGQAKGMSSVIGTGSGAISGLTYKQAVQDVADWFAWGQNEPGTGVHRGGWRYNPNSGTSDNSTAQWGALPLSYAESLGLGVAPHVKSELELWTNYVQNPAGGTYPWKDGVSGYDHPETYVNMSKTGGMLLQFAVEGKALSDPDVQAALNYMDSMDTYDHWNQGATTAYSQWYGGNLGNPYAMWAVYKGLATYDGLEWNDNGTPLDTSDDFLVGNPSLISTAPGGITIGYDSSPGTSVAGDWYSHYCDWLVKDQEADGNWSGYAYWYGPLAAGWYINILNATGAPPVVPAPAAVLLGAIGLAVSGWKLRRRKEL